MNNIREERIEKTKMMRGWNIALGILAIAMAVALASLSVLYILNRNVAQGSAANLESVYQRSFYELADNMNNAELKLDKLAASEDAAYQKKLLTELNQTCTNAQNNIAFLPLSANGIPETTTFINQLGGYCQSLLEGVSNGTKLNSQVKATFADLSDAVSKIKDALNTISKKMNQGYSLTHAASQISGDFNGLTSAFQQMKPDGQDYPTMIYDGPFSDSTLNKPIKGLDFPEVSREDAKAALTKMLKDFGVKEIKYQNEANGVFATYNFEVTLNGNIKLYAELTKKGGKLLTLSSYYTDGTAGTANISKEKGIETAEAFASFLELENMKAVWSEVLKGALYINLAPVINNTIVYPELIKVKIDLATGKIIGYESKDFYTNHTGDRSVGNPALSESQARAKMPSGYTIQSVRKAIIPKEYSADVLTWEVTAFRNGNTYYFYFNGQTGAEENILRVIETDNGNLLM